MRRSLPALQFLLHGRKNLSKTQRQTTNCTHTSVARLWGNWGGHVCQACHKHQEIGWIYVCTQDHGGNLPESDFICSPLSQDDKIGVREEVEISTWVLRAIERGEYTDEQVEILKEQKLGVRDAIRTAARSATPSSRSNSSSGLSSSADNTTFSSLTTALDEELQAACGRDPTLNLEFEKDLVTDEVIRSAQGSPMNHFELQIPACHYKCCHACRPTFRERAWLPLNTIVENPLKKPPTWDLDNRPISDARLVARMGLPKLHHPRAEPGPPPDFEWYGLESSKSDSESETEGLALRRTHSVRRRSHFREAVQNAIIRAMEQSRSSPSPTRRASFSSSRESLALSPITKRRGEMRGISSVGPVVDDGRLQGVVDRMVATNAPLSVTGACESDVSGEDDAAFTRESDIVMRV